MSENPIKKIKVGGKTYGIDYNALENLPELPQNPRKINIINYVPRGEDDPRPAKTGAYADGNINSIEIFRYACPDRLDVDTSFKKGEWVRKAETHSSYVGDGRQIYARDGDFGYPEIDGEGQFNFRPVFVANGFVLQPIITKLDGSPAVPEVDYNKLKSPWCTGIEGLYRITKVHSDLNIDMQAELESEMPSHTVTYRIVMPEVYSGSRPNVRVFRNEDQLEKYVVYGSYQAQPKESKELALGTELIDGKLLTFTQIESTKEGFVMYEATDKTYDDIMGFPAKPLTRDDAVKVNFIVEGEPHTPYVVADEKVLVAASAPLSVCDKLNKANEFAGMHVTKVFGDITITITIDDPFSITYTSVDPAGSEYELIKNCPENTAPEVGFMWGIKHNAGIEDKQDPRRQQDSAAAKEFAFSYINSITVDGEPIDIATAFEKVVVGKNDFNLTFKDEVITGNIVITVKNIPTAQAGE